MFYYIYNLHAFVKLIWHHYCVSIFFRHHFHLGEVKKTSSIFVRSFDFWRGNIWQIDGDSHTLCPSLISGLSLDTRMILNLLFLALVFWCALSLSIIYICMLAGADEGCRLRFWSCSSAPWVHLSRAHPPPPLYYALRVSYTVCLPFFRVIFWNWHLVGDERDLHKTHPRTHT